MNLSVTTVKISIISAIGLNNEIGLDNKLLWKSKSDLEHFKQLTLGKPIIMGRKTFESLPGILPGRPHIVITSNAPLVASNSPLVWWVDSVESALALSEHFGDEVFIIGGASIYEQALPLADELHISHMDWSGEADTFFPTIDQSLWNVRTISKHTGDLPWTYRKYTRRTI